MEKKKLLLVAISVGIFLALTIGAAILFFAPKDASTYSMASGKPVQAGDTGINAPAQSSAASGSTVRQDSNPQPSSVDPVDLVRQPKEVPGLQQTPEGANRQGDGFYVSGSGRSTETVINVPKPTTAAVPDVAPAGRAISATAQAVPKPAASVSSANSSTSTTTSSVSTATATTTTTTTSSASSSSASKPAAVAAPAAAAASKPAATTAVVAAQTQAKPAATQTKIYNDYWVQTGAFSTIANAEGVKATLSSKGITSIIENREVEGKTVFRVRVGPYISQNEANYWLALIKSINGFEDSQVRQTQSRR